MAQITLDVEAKVTSIQINTDGPRLVLQGVLRDTVTGDTFRGFSEDVTDVLTPTQMARVVAIATQAQAWADDRLAGQTG